jgi:hypothetical protein
MIAWEAKPLIASKVHDAEEPSACAHADAYLARPPPPVSGGGSRKWQIVAAAALSVTALAAVLPRHLNITVIMPGNNAGVTLNEAAFKPFDFTVKSGEYTDTPGLGYPFLNEARFVEPYRAAAFEVSGSGVTGCAWAATYSSGSGPWEDFMGVEQATTFAKRGTISAAATTTTSSTDDAVAAGTGLAFSVTFPAPGTYQISLTCSFEDGTSSSLVEEVRFQTDPRHRNPTPTHSTSEPSPPPPPRISCFFFDCLSHFALVYLEYPL